MFESMFGVEMPLAARFFLAFLVVLGLIGITAWAVRRFGSGRLGGAGARGRQPRLGVIDHASVDARRRLILVRRDNVEHLLMIGGPTDVVVEANIVRAAAAAPRDVGAARPVAAPEPLPRAIPLPEPAGNAWPLQPEPAPIRPAPRLEPIADEAPALQPQPQAEPPKPQTEPAAKRPQRDTLAALAEELSNRPASARRAQAPNPRPQSQAQPQPAEPQAEARPEARPEPRLPAPPAEAAEGAAADQSLAEMAQRLEAALRRPNVPPPPSAPATRLAPQSGEQAATSEPKLPPPPPALPRGARPAEPKPARPDAKPGQGKTLYDSLEQEMASLLGRPTNKN